MLDFSIDVAALEAELAAEVKRIDSVLDTESFYAATDGIVEAKAEHPYTDRTGELTGTATVERDYARGGAYMLWPEEYAGYVDRKRRFNFTKRAIDVAALSLRLRVDRSFGK